MTLDGTSCNPGQGLQLEGEPHLAAAPWNQARHGPTRPARLFLGGRPPAFDKEVHKHRNVVERCSNRLEQWRGIATH
ncbi:hypothetical protein ACFWXA_24300 [Streptomyces atroolivaceus]|uniref:hypothetical protein n=1 Tax=Streptomyces atroolivaceus TaxID=66869 RepID=UPI0036536A71